MKVIVILTRACIIAAATSLLAGCGGEPKTVTAAVVIDKPKPPLPRECDPAGRAPFPKVRKVTGNKTPVGALELAFVAAKKRDADNEAREKLCHENIKPQFTPPAPATAPAPAQKKTS